MFVFSFSLRLQRVWLSELQLRSNHRSMSMQRQVRWKNVFSVQGTIFRSLLLKNVSVFSFEIIDIKLNATAKLQTV
jgi:hypothetical protein